MNELSSKIRQAHRKTDIEISAARKRNEGLYIQVHDVAAAHADVSKEQSKFQKNEIDQHTSSSQKRRKKHIACFSCVTNDVNECMRVCYID